MPEEISVQILNKTSENIQKLFELSTRIDERVKSIHEKQEHLEDRIDAVMSQHVIIMQKIAVLESGKQEQTECVNKILTHDKDISELDKRLNKIENTQANHADRWNKIASFFIQLIWVILAAYMLTKLNLQAPAVP